MDRRLLNIEAFLEVVAMGTFSGAANKLKTSKSVISRRVSELETALGVQLLARTTRRLKLTPEGRTYSARLAPMIDMVDEANGLIQSKRDQPEGCLRILLPSYLGSSSITHTILPDFMASCPAVVLDVRLTDEGPLTTKSDFDVAIITRPRGRKLPDSSFRSLFLGRMSSGLFAAPSYLAEHGVPTDLDDLPNFRLLSYLATAWRFGTASGTDRVIEIEPAIRTGSNEILRSVTRRGGGIAYAFHDIFQSDLTTGHIVQILPEVTEQAGLDINLLLPAHRYPPLRVRRFADAIKAHFKGPARPVSTATTPDW
ncbi:MAG: LysR family transcriptional regulator [Myxococcota bacterium]|nr:LysR family transcriptional regulator [Myxococcota bacterium]